MISDHLLPVSYRRLKPLYVLSRNAAIDITSILQTAVFCDQRDSTLFRTPPCRGLEDGAIGGTSHSARAFQGPDSGSTLRCSLQDNTISHARSMSLRHSVERGYCVFANLPWVDYSMAAPTRSFHTSYWANYKRSREGALKVANPSSSIIMMVTCISRASRIQLTAESLLYTRDKSGRSL